MTNSSDKKWIFLKNDLEIIFWMNTESKISRNIHFWKTKTEIVWKMTQESFFEENKEEKTEYYLNNIQFVRQWGNRLKNDSALVVRTANKLQICSPVGLPYPAT